MKILSIKKSADFQQKNHSSAVKFHTHSFTLVANPTAIFYWHDHQKKRAKIFCRFGLVVSKKASKLATERNLVKRRFRSCFYGLSDAFKKQQIDYIFIAKSATINLQYSKINQDMQYALSKINKQLQ